MTRTFNAIEVFEIAEQIERNGAAFYRSAAELFGSADASGLFRKLASWELKHEAIFAAMRKQLGGEDRELSSFDPDDVPLDAKAMAGLAVFGLRPDPAVQLTGSETQPEVLNMAIQKEKDSIVYYIGLKEFVRGEGEKDKIDDIIDEEMHHIRIIAESLEQCE